MTDIAAFADLLARDHGLCVVNTLRRDGSVQAPIVQQVRGSLGTHDQGLIITTSDFSSGARTEAERVGTTSDYVKHTIIPPIHVGSGGEG